MQKLERCENRGRFCGAILLWNPNICHDRLGRKDKWNTQKSTVLSQLFDRIELQCLQPEFRYNHPHAPGDVTICTGYKRTHYRRFALQSDDANLMLTLPRQAK
jgi:hypothetical protein